VLRGPGREPLGTAPGLWLQGRLCPPGPACPPWPLGPPLGRVIKDRPPWPDCGRIGCPGRGPLGRSLPGAVPGTGPRFPPVGMGGRTGVVGRDEGEVAPAAGRAPAGCVPGCGGRVLTGAPCGGRAVIGCPGAATGRAVVAGPGLCAAVGAAGAGGAVGFADGGAAVACFAAGAGVPGGATGGAGFGGPGTTLVAAAGAAGTCGGAGATGFAAMGAGGAADGAGGCLTAGFRGSFTAAAGAASASATPFRWLRTFSATSTGIELE